MSDARWEMMAGPFSQFDAYLAAWWEPFAVLRGRHDGDDPIVYLKRQVHRSTDLPFAGVRREPIGPKDVVDPSALVYTRPMSVEIKQSRWQVAIRVVSDVGVVEEFVASADIALTDNDGIFFGTPGDVEAALS